MSKQASPPKRTGMPYPGRFALYARQTPAQTLGPFFHQGLLRPRCSPFGADLTGPQVAGVRVQIEGQVVDGLGRPVADALIETWQADSQGRYAGGAEDSELGGGPSLVEESSTTAFEGFGRCATDAQGRFRLVTIRPGRTELAQARGDAAPIHVILGARGLMHHLFSRIYFSDDPHLATDSVLGAVPEARRPTLIAQREDLSPAPSGDGARFVWDVCLQGPNETVFFDV